MQHYSHAESPDGNQHYSQSDVQRTRLTLYALTAALLAKDGKLGPSMLSGLRGALKIPQPTLTKLLRCAAAMCRKGRVWQWWCSCTLPLGTRTGSRVLLPCLQLARSYLGSADLQCSQLSKAVMQLARRRLS